MPHVLLAPCMLHLSADQCFQVFGGVRYPHRPHPDRIHASVCPYVCVPPVVTDAHFGGSGRVLRRHLVHRRRGETSVKADLA